MPKKERDYKEEYKYHGTPAQRLNRSRRNIARRALGLEKGDPLEAGHKKPLSKGGSNSKKNVVAQTRKKNRTDYNNED
tara:strand:- start:6843 stop:7076 length:234 start_codon:yes stop_codon:yes gene_type:complete